MISIYSRNGKTQLKGSTGMITFGSFLFLAIIATVIESVIVYGHFWLDDASTIGFGISFSVSGLVAFSVIGAFVLFGVEDIVYLAAAFAPLVANAATCLLTWAFLTVQWRLWVRTRMLESCYGRRIFGKFHLFRRH